MFIDLDEVGGVVAISVNTESPMIEKRSDGVISRRRIVSTSMKKEGVGEKEGGKNQNFHRSAT